MESLANTQFMLENSHKIHVLSVSIKPARSSSSGFIGKLSGFHHLNLHSYWPWQPSHYFLAEIRVKSLHCNKTKIFLCSLRGKTENWHFSLASKQTSLFYQQSLKEQPCGKMTSETICNISCSLFNTYFCSTFESERIALKQCNDFFLIHTNFYFLWTELLSWETRFSRSLLQSLKKL